MTATSIHNERHGVASSQSPIAAGQQPHAAAQDALDKTGYLECRRHGVPCRMIALRLGWSKRRAERVRQRINRERKLETHTPPEHVIGRMRFGSMTPETLWYPQVTADSQSACLQTSNIGHKLFNMKVDLYAKLEDANRRLTQLILDGTACDVLITELTPVAAKAETAAQAEREVALIESRPEKENVIRAALVAQKRLDESVAKTRTITGAIERQKEAITAIQADIVNNRDADFLRELQELRLRERLLRQAAEIAATVYEIGVLGGKHDVCGIWLMNPTPIYQYPDTRAMHYCDALNILVGAVVGFSQVRSLMDKAA